MDDYKRHAANALMDLGKYDYRKDKGGAVLEAMMMGSTR